jgi:hypothetical protein
MIDWDLYKYNEEICIRVLNEGVINEMTVKLLDYGWHEHGRIRITAIVEIIKSDDPTKWHLGAKIELPIKTDGKIKFHIIEKTLNIPRQKTVYEGEIIAVC